MKYLIFSLLFLLACKDESTPITHADNAAFYGHVVYNGTYPVNRNLWLKGVRYEIYSAKVPDCSEHIDGELITYLEPGTYEITANDNYANTVTKTITIQSGICNKFYLDNISQWP